jgi:hypothetical protein
MLAIAPVIMSIVAACLVLVTTRRPWRIVQVRSSTGPYRESKAILHAIERVPMLVRIGALFALMFAQFALTTLVLAFVELRWDGIAVGVLPFGGLGIATALAGFDLLRPDERTQGRVRVIARGLLAYGLPLVGFGLLHEVVLEHHAGMSLSFGVVAVSLGAAGVTCGTVILASCKHLDDAPIEAETL